MISPASRRLWSKGSRSISLGPRRQGERTLTRQHLLRRLLLIVRTRQGREESDEIVDIFLRQRKRLDVLVEVGILQSIALVVVIYDVPERLLRSIVKVRSRHQYVAQVRRLEGGDIELFLGDEKAAQRGHIRLNSRPIDGARVSRFYELLGMPSEGNHIVPDDADLPML